MINKITHFLKGASIGRQAAQRSKSSKDRDAERGHSNNEKRREQETDHRPTQKRIIKLDWTVKELTQLCTHLNEQGYYRDKGLTFMFNQDQFKIEVSNHKSELIYSIAKDQFANLEAYLKDDEGPQKGGLLNISC